MFANLSQIIFRGIENPSCYNIFVKGIKYPSFIWYYLTLMRQEPKYMV